MAELSGHQGDGEAPNCPTCNQPLEPDGKTCPACAAQKPFGLPPINLAPQQDARPNDAPPPPRVDGEDNQSNLAFFERLNSYAGQMPIVVFIGFQTAGKTWLLHRLKEQLFTHRGVDCDPQFVSVADAPDAEDGALLEASTDYEFHDVYTRSPYVLIDTPGEQTELMLNGNLSGLIRLVAAIQQASALVVSLPADNIIFGDDIHGAIRDKDTVIDSWPQQTRQTFAAWRKAFEVDNRRLSQFTRGLFKLSLALSCVKESGLDFTKSRTPQEYDALQNRFREVTTDARIRQHARSGKFEPIGGNTGLRCPTLFALTKADRVYAAFEAAAERTSRPADADKQKFGRIVDRVIRKPEYEILKHIVETRWNRQEGDASMGRPADAVRHANPALHRRILRYFPMSKFDFVTAFFGHDGSPKLTAQHYSEHPALGVVEIQDWIRKARRLSAVGDRKLSRYFLARQIHHYIHRIRVMDDEGI